MRAAGAALPTVKLQLQLPCSPGWEHAQQQGCSPEVLAAGCLAGSQAGCLDRGKRHSWASGSHDSSMLGPHYLTAGPRLHELLAVSDRREESGAHAQRAIRLRGQLMALGWSILILLMLGSGNTERSPQCSRVAQP